MAYSLSPLPYAYNALEPFVDATTMEIHHSKHHAAYITNLNAALEKYPEWQGLAVEDLLLKLDQLPADIYWPVRNNAGGHYNHGLFWNMMAAGGSAPGGDLLAALEAHFGSVEAFREAFGKAATGRFGSGWAWLVKNQDGSLEVVSTPNQDNPITDGKVPLLGLDVWEHAYYLKYQNRRAEYISGWWNVVNWDEVSRRFRG